MNVRSLALLLLILPFPALATASTTGPDEQGAWTLQFHVDRIGTFAARLDVLREDVEGTRAGSRALGDLTFSGPSDHSFEFLPAEGSGRYVVGLMLEEERVDEVTFEVADAPTYLNLTHDDVNANGKTKSPGDVIITRGTLSDANGLAELDGVLWRVVHANATVNTGALPLAYAPGATSAPFELRYDHAPLAPGEHTLTFIAQKGASAVASVSRTFIIRDVAPTFVSGSLPNVTPDAAQSVHGVFTLADRNGPIGPFAPELRVYKGSTRMEGAGFSAMLGAPTRLADAGGAGRWSYPLTLSAPALAAAGAHRVSLYANGSLLGTAPFDVLPLPTLRSVAAVTQGGRLQFEINASGEGILTARLDDGHGGATTLSARAGTTNLTLEPPRRGAPLAWTVQLRAREGGAVIAERNGTWTAPLNGPALALAPIHVRARLPALWSLEAGEWDATQARAEVSFTRWDGAPEPALLATVSGGRVRVDAPADLPAGRYSARMHLVWPNGSASETAWSFEAGPWVQVELGAPTVLGRNASVPLRNTGALGVTRLIVEVEPEASVLLRVGDTTHAPTRTRGRLAFAGFTLAPGAEAEFEVTLPAGPLPSGAQNIALRVLARVEVG